jgi:hypothetical protein
MTRPLVLALLIAFGMGFLGGCATAPPDLTADEQAQACRAAMTEIAGRLEAQKRLKKKYPKSLSGLPKDQGPLPGNVNGFPIEYYRTKTGFRLSCQYEKSGLTECKLDQLGTFKCQRAGNAE